jgi:hypothetical protein
MDVSDLGSNTFSSPKKEDVKKISGASPYGPFWKSDISTAFEFEVFETLVTSLL